MRSQHRRAPSRSRSNPRLESDYRRKSFYHPLNKLGRRWQPSSSRGRVSDPKPSYNHRREDVQGWKKHSQKKRRDFRNNQERENNLKDYEQDKFMHRHSRVAEEKFKPDRYHYAKRGKWQPFYGNFKNMVMKRLNCFRNG